MIASMRKLLEMIRFSHTAFALPFALSSALLAWQKPKSFHVIDVVGILLCMVFARSAAMSFNRLADKSYDALNPRTAKRHLPAGLLSTRTAWTFTAVCIVGFVAATGLFLLREPPNPWPLCLALPVLLFVGAYSYTKRFTSLCHFWLGASLLLAPLAAWIAIRGMEDLATPLVLGAAVFFWVAGFDILYACQDVEFDRSAGLSSVPVKLGVTLSLRVALLCHLIMVLLLIALYWVADAMQGWVYPAGVAGVAILLTYEHWLVKPNDLSRVNQAFFHVNGVISIGLLLIVVVQLLVR